MKQLMANLALYKHYLILLAALLVANYLLMPLVELQEQQQQSLQLIEKRRVKVNELIANKGNFEAQLTQSSEAIKASSAYVFSDESEARFKLASQSVIETILNKAGCDTERIGFKGNTILNDNLKRWVMEVRYKGDSECMVKVTRGIEASMPVLQITDLNFNHRSLKEEGAGNFNAQLSVNVWHAQGLFGNAKSVSTEQLITTEQG